MDFDEVIENQRIKSDPQEKEPVLYCEDCNKAIYANEQYYRYYGDDLCEDCIDDRLHIEKEQFERIAGE